VHPEHGQLIQPGYIYVAPPDFHLLIESSRVQLWRGPRENRQRPSVNVLFRSAAVAYGPRVIGVILSGTLDDGATGLWWVKKHGGVAVVQTPSDAEFEGMPITALEHVDVNEVIPAREIGPYLADLAIERAEIEVTRNRARGEGAKWKRSS
jgi:two-component system chemotaxis response regulator CheB